MQIFTKSATFRILTTFSLTVLLKIWHFEYSVNHHNCQYDLYETLTITMQMPFKMQQYIEQVSHPPMSSSYRDLTCTWRSPDLFLKWWVNLTHRQRHFLVEDFGKFTTKFKLALYYYLYYLDKTGVLPEYFWCTHVIHHTTPVTTYSFGSC